MQIIDRISELLDILAPEKDGCSVSEISERMKLSPSSVHRMLTSLRNIGYVVQDSDTKKYKIGLKILTLAVRQLNHYDIRSASIDHMEELSRKTDNLVFLSVYQNNLVVCIETVELTSSMKFYVNIGSEMPINAAAAAQAIFAFKSDEEVDEILNHDKFKKYTDRTITSPEQLKDKLLEVRKNGYAICDRELEEGVIAISAPIRDFSNRVVGSLTLTGIINENSINQSLIDDVVSSADQISRELGCLH